MMAATFDLGRDKQYSSLNMKALDEPARVVCQGCKWIMVTVVWLTGCWSQDGLSVVESISHAVSMLERA